MSRFALLVTVRVHPGAADEFRRRILDAAAAAVREEEHCHSFQVAQDEEDPLSFVLFEVYTDAAALAHHHTTPHFQAFLRDAGHLMAERARRRLTLFDG